MTRKKMVGRRRRPQGLASLRMGSSYFCAALAALTARAPSRLLTQAFLLNSNPAVSTRSRAPPSACYGGSRSSISSWSWVCGGGSSSSTARQASSLFAMDGGRSRGLASTISSRQRGATATSRGPTALAAAGSRRSRGEGVGSGDDADEGRVGGVWAVQDEEEWEFEEEVQRLETRLEAAVKHEDYKGAAKCRDELYRIHMDETSAVLSTNSAFYAAFTAKDADRMTSLWMPSNDVMCIHPGDEPVVGQQAVARSWRSLFRSGDSRFSSSVIKPTEVRVRVRGTTAIVQCNEEVTTRLAPSPSPSSSSLDSASKSGDDGSSHKKDAAAWLAQVISDNPYEPGSDKSIVGNPTTADDRARIKKAVGKHGAASIKKAVDTAFAQTSAAAKGQGASSGGGGGGKKKKSKPRFLNVTNIYRKAGGRWLMVHHHASLPPPAQSSSERRAAMGIDGLEDGMEGMTRIINLSDMGGSGFGGGGGGKDNKLEDMLEALRNRLPGGLPGGIGGTGSGRTPSSGMIIIGDTDDDDDDDDEDERDEDDDDDEEEEEDEEDDEEDDGDDDHEVTDVTSSSSSSVEGKEKGDPRWGKEDFTEDLTKKTVQALRTLVEINLLGKEEQRRLMTDVIQHATGDEASAVEVAYELLLAHSNEDLEDNESLAEFVDQCKILASSLFEEDKNKKRWRRR